MLSINTGVFSDEVVSASNLNRQSVAFDVTGVAYRLIQGEGVSSENPYAWLRTFDADDLKDFVEEVRSTIEQFEDSPRAWEELDTLIYEWHESALVIDSGILDVINSPQEM